MQIQNLMKVPVLVFNRIMLYMVHIANDAPPITYVYGATVDGRSLACLCMSVLVFAPNGKRRLHQNVFSFLLKYIRHESC